MRNTLKSESPPKLLIIDDDEMVTDFIKDVAKEMNFLVNCVNDYESVIATLKAFSPDTIFLDLRLSGYDGVEVLHLLAEIGCQAKIFLISGIDRMTLNSASEVGKQHNLNIAGVVSKPVLIEDIEQALGNEQTYLSRFTSPDFQAVLGEGEFQLTYMPRISTEAPSPAALSAVEVKVHWVSAKNLEQPLATIKPKLLEANLLATFSRQLIDKALETCKSWLDKGLYIGIVINLEKEITLDHTLPGHLISAANKWGISPAHVTINVSKEIAMTGNPEVLDLFTRLRIKGFNLSVETSGADSVELDRLVHLPINEFKLEPDIIASLDYDIEAEFNVSTLVSLANKLGLSTCADGVYNKNSFLFICGCGCTAAQGAYVSRPLTHSQVEKFSINKRISDDLQTLLLPL